MVAQDIPKRHGNNDHTNDADAEGKVNNDDNDDDGYNGDNSDLSPRWECGGVKGVLVRSEEIIKYLGLLDHHVDEGLLL